MSDATEEIHGNGPQQQENRNENPEIVGMKFRRPKTKNIPKNDLPTREGRESS